MSSIAGIFDDDPYVAPGLPERPLRGKVVGFTGSRGPLTETDAELITRTLTGLRKVRGFVTGGCTGVDADVGRWLAGVYPDVPHLVLLPANRSLVCDWWTEYTATWDDEFGPAARIIVRSVPGTYADRNQAIVTASNVLVAFPAYPEQHPASKRSGTWQTVRMARKINLKIHEVVLNSSGS